MYEPRKEPAPIDHREGMLEIPPHLFKHFELPAELLKTNRPSYSQALISAEMFKRKWGGQ